MYDIEAKEYTLLLVDDKPENLVFLSAYLEKQGFNLLIARYGAEVFSRIEYQRPDLILLDILMPGMDGFEVCQRLQADPETRNIPVIFATALTETVDKVRGFSLGAVDYITKPFELDEVLARIKTHLTICKLNQQLIAAEKHQCQEHMEKLRRSIITRIPHELRTPLTGILGLSEFMLQMYKGDDNTLRDFTQDIKNSAERLNQYVEKYLFYIETELIASHPQRNASLREAHLPYPASVMKETCDYIAKRANRLDDLEKNLPGLDNVVLAISAEHFQRIIGNLVDNAFKFSNAGQAVTISAEYNDQHLICTIQDQGRGMTSEQIDKIGALVQFERDQHEQQGAGIELVTAQKLCKIYGGDLEIDSAGKNQGCRVTLRFLAVNAELSGT